MIILNTINATCLLQKSNENDACIMSFEIKNVPIGEKSNASSTLLPATI